MSIQLKISGATPKSGKSICASCKHAKHIVGQNCQQVTFCHLFAGFGSSRGPVPFRVAECNDYHPATMPWLHEMEEMAWKIEARRRGPAGFGDAVTQTEMEVIVSPPTKPNYHPDLD